MTSSTAASSGSPAQRWDGLHIALGASKSRVARFSHALVSCTRAGSGCMEEFSSPQYCSRQGRLEVPPRLSRSQCKSTHQRLYLRRGGSHMRACCCGAQFTISLGDPLRIENCLSLPGCRLPWQYMGTPNNAACLCTRGRNSQPLLQYSRSFGRHEQLGPY